MTFSSQAIFVVSILVLGIASPGWAESPWRDVEGSRPERVVPLDDGRITLFPETAEFYGKEIRINPDNFCIAWWSESDDFVAWEMDLPDSGKYEVWIQWAIADDQAGNPFFVQVGDQQLTSKIAKSGGWTSFGHASVGVLELPAGRQRLEMRPQGELQGELADIRGITLNPIGSQRPPTAPDFPAKSPAASLTAIRVHPEMQVELVAAEPLVRDPIAIAWGPDLKLWVVEMGDYPLGVDGRGGKGGRIKFLEDIDSDGRYDKATLFLDRLNFPTGILPYGKGVLVTCAPDIFYAEDTDGDGRADKQKVLFTGFPERNQQHRVNGLRWGFDNWIYCANGDGGVGGETTITSSITGQKLDLGTRDFRFRPASGEMEAQSGPTQFGRNQDNAGNWFGSNNGQPLYHFALDEHYLTRNKRLAPPDPRVQMFHVGGPFYARAPLIAFHGEQQTLAPVARPVGLGGACSGMIYRDELLGDAFAGNAFVCDPVTNLVHRRILTEDGITFSSTRAEDEPDSEFFASTDPWTRPTMVQTGPDGALYLIDMYRLYIEHPQWINESVLSRADLRAGNDRGRIYRIYPRNAKPRPMQPLDKLSDIELVQALDSPSPWQRDTVQQRIVAGKNQGTTVPLLKLLTTSKRPATRLQALGTIAGLDIEFHKQLMLAIEDEDPAVRRWAAKFAEPYLNKSPALAALLVKLADDPDPKVVMQVAYTLGEWKNPRAGKLLAQLIAQHRDDSYLVTAALSSAPGHQVELLAELFAAQDVDEQLLSRAIEACAAPGEKAFDTFIAEQLVLSPKQNGTARQFLLLAALLEADQREQAESLKPIVASLLKRAREVVEDESAAEALRAIAIRSLARDQATLTHDMELLSEQLLPTAPFAVAESAIDRLAELDDPSIGKLLASRWAEFSPGLRSQVFDILLARADWTLALLKEFEQNKQLANSLDTARRQRLSTHQEEGIRTRAERILGAAQDPDRLKIVAQYAAAVTQQGDIERGRAVFKKNCAACHRLENEGHVIGPDLTAIKDKSPPSILEAVLNPNRAVEDKFMAYSAQTVDGRILTGLVQVEAGNSITLAAAEGRTQTILRSQLEQLVSTGRSLMPDGFEKNISPAEMSDLLAYLAQVGANNSTGPAKQLGAPPITADTQGVIRLLATQAALKGQHVGINVQAGCIAWMVEGEQATWSFELPKAGNYEVHVEWAQIDELANNPFVIEAAGKQVAGKFPSTQGWSNYHSARFGAIALPAGRVQLTLRPSGPVKTELADVRAIKLVPR